MPQIRPITDLRNTTEISDLCHARREPVFITKNGYGDLVVTVSYTHLRAHETDSYLVCRLLLEKKKKDGLLTRMPTSA